MPALAFNEETFRDLLPFYYRRLFPFKQFFEWITYGDENTLQFRNREFSFTLENDIYVRYQSFRTTKDMEIAIKKKNPHKIDIGAVYNYEPKHHKRVALVPSEKELVFDIDMTDYDDVRSCCQGADVCIKCWKFMSIACKVLDKALRDDFDFHHLLWVFSGRRGIHCWVCDESARRLDNAGRGAVAGYLQLDLTRPQIPHRDKSHHPAISRALAVIERDFVDMLVDDQDILGTDEKIQKMLEKIPQEFAKDLFKKLKLLPTSRDRWNKLVTHVQRTQAKNPTGRSSDQLAISEIMLRHAYPRLDINVSTGLNHLLKAPFCVHPKSGKVCVPFNVKSVDKFDPASVPTLTQLVEELRHHGEKEDEAQARELASEAALKPRTSAPPEEAERTEMEPLLEDNASEDTESLQNAAATSPALPIQDDCAAKANDSPGQEGSGAEATGVASAEDGKVAEISGQADGQASVEAETAKPSRADSVSQRAPEGQTRCIMEETPAEEVVGLTATERQALKERQSAELAEINRSTVVKDYRKTSMYKGILVFETFLRKLKAAHAAADWDLAGEIDH